MPDRTDSGQGRDALDAELKSQHDFLVEVGLALPGRCAICGWTLSDSEERGCVYGNCSYRPGDHSPEQARMTEQYRKVMRAIAARAAVRKAAREMGEEFTVDRVYGQAVIHVGADGQFFDKGDRVRVVKVEP